MATSILTPQKVGSLSGGYDYSLNPYIGCAFGCSYCYVPKFPQQEHHFSEWGQWVKVKINAPLLIRKDRLKVFGSSIFFSSATDPYQYVELQYRLTRRCLQELLNYQPARLTLHTRSHLMLQDLNLLKQFGSALSVGISIPTDDDRIRHEFEPNAPNINKRLLLIRTLSEAGIRIHASLTPLLPCNPERLVQILSPLVGNVWIGSMQHLEINNKPYLLEKYRDFFEWQNYRNVQEKLRKAFNLSIDQC